MVSILNLKCPNCSGSLEISPEMTSFACGFCGVSQIVERKGGTVSLKVIVDAVARVQIGTDKTAAELAIQRLKGEMEEVNQNYIRLVNQKKKNLQEILTPYIAIFAVISLIFCCSALDSSYAILFVILWIGAGVGMGIIFFKHQKTIENRWEPDIVNTALEYKELKKRLAKQKKIADS